MLKQKQYVIFGLITLAASLACPPKQQPTTSCLKSDYTDHNISKTQSSIAFEDDSILILKALDTLSKDPKRYGCSRCFFRLFHHLISTG